MIKLFYLDIRHTENIVNKSIKKINKNKCNSKRSIKNIKKYKN